MTTATSSRRSAAKPSDSARSKSGPANRSDPVRPRVVGCEVPRIFTPPLRDLTEETTLGFSVIRFSERVLGVDLYPWQRWLLVHMLELLEDGSLRFRTVVVLVARQNGKSTLSQVLALWFMFVYGCALVIGTAQDLDVAEEIWQGAVDLVEENPRLDKLKKRVVKVNGKKSLELRAGNRYKVKAANRRAGRGLAGDLILLDELREHQTWEAWAAITKTTMARAEALILALSNAGDALSIVLRHLRKMAHVALGDPDGINAEEVAPAVVDPDDEDDAEEIDEDTLAIFEWSAPPGARIRDRAAWAQANPSLGYGGFTEKTVASAARTDPEWVFRTEVLCQWSDGSIEGPFPPGSWESCRLVVDRSPLLEVSPVTACVDVSWDRTASHISVAGLVDGVVNVDMVASRAGTEWVIPWLRERPGRFAGVVVQARGAPVSSLVEALKADGLPPLIEWQGDDLGKAHGSFYDLVKAAGLRVPPHPILDRAASSAVVKPLGDAWVFDRKRSPVDCASLIAAVGAVWGLGQVKLPGVSVYETRRLVVAGR